MIRTLQIAILGLIIPFLGLAQAPQQELTAAQLAYAAVSASATVPVFGAAVVDQEDQVVFYPNPVKDYLNVRFPKKGTHSIVIYNIIGEKIADKTMLETDLVRVDLSALPRGMYFLSYEVMPGKLVTKTFSKS